MILHYIQCTCICAYTMYVYTRFDLFQAMWTRFFPAIVELRRQLSIGKIGDVKLVQANFGFKREDPSCKTRFADPSQGGGSVLEVGVYPISFATMIYGEKPESVHASGWLTSSGKSLVQKSSRD